MFYCEFYETFKNNNFIEHLRVTAFANPGCSLKTQPWESRVAVGNAVVNVVLCGIYDNEKTDVLSFSIFTTYTSLLINYERLISLLCIA